MTCPMTPRNKNGFQEPCLNSCAFYINGKCAIRILAEKSIYDVKKDKKSKE